MRILEVASSLYDWGGIERYVQFLSEGLSAKGHEVVVVCPSKSPLDERWHGPKRFLSNRAQFSPATYLAFRRIAKELKPEIAHIHFSPDFVMPALALRGLGVKVVLTRHLVLPWSPAKVKRYTKLFNHIIPVSDAVCRKLAESGVPEKMMTVAKAGVPAPSATPSSLSEGPLRLGCFGRLVPEKGVDTLLRAMVQSPSSFAEIYGDGPYRSNLEKLTHDLGLGDRASFHGFVSDVSQGMNAVDAVCVPSTWDEAFPYSVLEAMAIGKAVFASNAGGLPELVSDGDTGRLFPRGDAEALGRILEEFSKDKSALSTMGKRGMEIHRAEYTVERMAERIESVFAKVLAS
jgi:glycosyltransferase involved in cell wall biosynthesis